MKFNLFWNCTENPSGARLTRDQNSFQKSPQQQIMSCRNSLNAINLVKIVFIMHTDHLKVYLFLFQLFIQFFPFKSLKLTQEQAKPIELK